MKPNYSLPPGTMIMPKENQEFMMQARKSLQGFLERQDEPSPVNAVQPSSLAELLPE